MRPQLLDVEIELVMQLDLKSNWKLLDGRTLVVTASTRQLGQSKKFMQDKDWQK